MPLSLNFTRQRSHTRSNSNRSVSSRRSSKSKRRRSSSSSRSLRLRRHRSCDLFSVANDGTMKRDNSYTARSPDQPHIASTRKRKKKKKNQQRNLAVLGCDKSLSIVVEDIILPLGGVMHAFVTGFCTCGENEYEINNGRYVEKNEHENENENETCDRIEAKRRERGTATTASRNRKSRKDLKPVVVLGGHEMIVAYEV